MLPERSRGRYRRSRPSFFIKIPENESCTNNDGIVHVHGALHAEGLPTAYELILLAYPAFRVLTARRASAHSKIEAERLPYAAPENELSGRRLPMGTAWCQERG